MGKFTNALGNTAGVVPRTAGTVVHWGIDTLKAAGNVFSDFWDVVQNTSSQLKEVLSSSRNTGKWYNKLYQVPAGVVIGAGTVVEGAVRSVLEPARNAVLNVRDVFGNFFKNIGNTIGWTFDTTRPVSDFRFEHLKTKKTTGKNWFSSLAWWKKSGASSSSSSTPTSSAPSQAAAASVASASVSPQITQAVQAAQQANQSAQQAAQQASQSAQQANQTLQQLNQTAQQMQQTFQQMMHQFAQLSAQNASSAGAGQNTSGGLSSSTTWSASTSSAPSQANSSSGSGQNRSGNKPQSTNGPTVATAPSP